MRLIGLIMVLGAVLAALGEWLGIRLPTLSGLFSIWTEIGMTFPFLKWMKDSTEMLGWVSTGIIFLIGLYFVIKFSRKGAFTPLMERRIQRFKGIQRGYWSLWILLILALLASLDFLLVGSQALVVKYEGKYYYPAFQKKNLSEDKNKGIYQGEDFGVEGDLAQAPVNWRERKQFFKKEKAGNWALLPLLPYSPTGDTITATSLVLKEKEGKLYQGSQIYRGLASKVYDIRHPEARHIQVTVRDGIKQGDATGWNEKREQVFTGKYVDNRLVRDSVSWTGAGSVDDFLNLKTSEWRRVSFPPSIPTIADTPRHLLGTTSQGYDTVAYLYGGLQVNFMAALLYIPFVYFIGISVGLLMGYFGGWFDLIVQRLIEIFSNIPFLYVVMIAGASVPVMWKEKFGLTLIVVILAIFGWMGMTYLMRTSALKEKARDYIAASRVIGASTPRIIFRHLFPNSVAIIVTIVPFSISSLVMSLTALDYLGFGLPDRYASWGKLLRDGLENLTAPWLVTSAFVMLVSLLVLVTFVGEAVREAFDPKKFTFYR